MGLITTFRKLSLYLASLATVKFNEVIKIHDPDKPLTTFDSRAWKLPYDKVMNYFIWRQQDATKNSISMVAQANFPHKQLQGLNGKQLEDAVFVLRGSIP